MYETTRIFVKFVFIDLISQKYRRMLQLPTLFVISYLCDKQLSIGQAPDVMAALYNILILLAVKNMYLFNGSSWI